MRQRQARIAIAVMMVIHFLALASVVFGQHVPETRLVPVPSIELPAIGPSSRWVGTETQSRLYPDGEWLPVHGETSVIQTLSRQPDGSFWKWSPDNWHHKAAVRVKERSGAGSGVCIATESGHCLVLSNHHVVSSSRTVTIDWPGGAKAAGHVVSILQQDYEDVALIYVPQPDPNWLGLPIAVTEPPLGSQLEMVGFGGPEYGRKRSFYGARVQMNGSRKTPLEIDAATISGDSGSGILWNGHIVGINWGGMGRPTNFRGVGLIWPACSGVSPTKLSRWIQAQCGPGGSCPPGASPRFGDPRGGFYNPPDSGLPPGMPAVPPAPQVPTIPQPTQPIVNNPPATPPATPPTICVPLDLEKLKDEIVAEVIAQIPKPKDGANGKDGKDGRDGVDGRPGTISEGQLAAIVAAVLEQQPRRELTQEDMDFVMKNLPPIYLRKIGPDGKEVIEPIHLGEGMTFRMFPHNEQHK